MAPPPRGGPHAYMCAYLEFVAHLVLAVVGDALLLRPGHEAVLEAARVELGGGSGVVAGL